MRVTADTAGAFYASLTVPNVAAGAYPIRASLSESSHTDSEVIFTAIPRLTLSPTGGSPGTLITITGSGFEANKSGPAWFDTNRDGILTEGEPSSQATSDASGRIITTLVVPGGFISTGSYPVRVELPQGSPVKVSANFIIKGPSLALSASKAIPGGTINVVGRRFPANTAGWVWFDANGNSARDAGEVSKKVTTNSYGGFITGMTIPKVPAGVHYIRADLPGSGTDDAAVTIVILAEPSLSLSLTNGSPGTIIIINGKDFKTWTSGRVWFDIDGDGKKDAGEPAKNVKTDNFGKFRAALAVPERVKRGAYAVYADIPAWGKPEAWADFFVTSNRPSDDVNGHALDVVRTTPYDDAANVKRYPAIQVVFNGRIIKGADYWGISLSDEDGNEVRIKIAIRNNSIKVWPSGMLKKETTYMLFIPADAVQDMREKGLSEEFALTFTTKK
ncbi:MAG: Ig-like domain-containing protein [Candidatus Aquicultor sp.]|nr:Ig-like domain-containing protein [Candidatus Aquicultor sp.]